MNVNSAVYQSSASYKLLNTTFAAIVNEAFINALPFNRYDMSEENERTLGEYTQKVVESFGGFDSLTYAMNNEKDPAKKQFLMDIRNICLETTNQAVSRVTSGKKITQEDMVAAPTLDKKEYAEYVEKADKLDLDRVAEIVKEKVLKTLDEEKEARERNDEVNQALKEAIAAQDEKAKEEESEDEDEETDEEDTEEKDTEDEDDEDNEESEDEESEEDEDEESDSDDEDDSNKKDSKKSKKDEKDDQESDKDKATESFLSLLSGSALRRPDHHRSFFNTILNKAMEQIVATEHVAIMDTDEISKDRILDLTLESTLPSTFNYKPTSDRALNFVMNYTTSQKLNKEERKTVIESALVDATIAYTMLETLHTMNLIKPGVMDMKVATESYTPINRKYDSMRTTVSGYVMESIRNARPRYGDTKYEKIDKLEAGIENLTTLNTCLPEDSYFDKSHKALTSAIESMKADLNKLNSPVNVPKESYFEKRAMESYKAQMNKVAGLVGFYNGRAHKVVLEHFDGSSVMDVKIYGIDQSPLITSHITMEGFHGGANELISIAHGTKLDSSDMPPVFYKKMDGYGREIMIK